MILLGVMVGVWGALVLGFSKPMHVRWKGMLAQMRRDRFADQFGEISIPLTRWLASPEGLRGMRIAGGLALAAGVTMIVAGLLRGEGL